MLDNEEIDWFKNEITRTRNRINNIRKEEPYPLIDGTVSNSLYARLQHGKSAVALINSHFLPLDDFIVEYNKLYW